ncbi:MAG: flagellin lysine-N-methylase [Alphaproteobacteria bacterium]|nr:flagellin lysine-N-methylase [Alphaproteobacteria bacterium]
MGDSTLPITQHRYIQEFQCLTDRCPDTCCSGTWGMQIGDRIVDLYQQAAPELLDMVKEHENGLKVIACDTAGNCSQYDQGLCRVHASYGETFLGDACYFYPRIVRTVGGKPLMMGALSCPEVARLALYTEQPFQRLEGQITRLPENVKDIVPDPLNRNNVFSIHDLCLTMVEDTSVNADFSALRLLSIGLSLDNLAVSMWPVALPFYISSVDQRLQLYGIQKNRKSFKYEKIIALLHFLVHAKTSPKVKQLFCILEDIVYRYPGNNLDDEVEAVWSQEAGEQGERVLSRWLQATVVTDNFPFAGIASSAGDRARLITIRYFVLKGILQLLTYKQGGFIDAEEVIVVVYRMSRLFDHLSTADYLLDSCKKLGIYHFDDLACLLEYNRELA